jgi:hypothetical protein
MIGRRRSEGAPVGAAHPSSLLADLTGYGLLRRRADRGNIELLRAELGCTLDDARRLYSLAHEHGFGAAYEMVFGAPPRPPSRRPIAVPPRRASGRCATASRQRETQPS